MDISRVQTINRRANMSFSTKSTHDAPIATKVVCFSCLLKCLRSLYGKQCGPRSDCSYRSSLFWAHAVCLYTLFVSKVRQLFAADNFSRRHFQMHFFLGASRINASTKKKHLKMCQMKSSAACKWLHRGVFTLYYRELLKEPVDDSQQRTFSCH